MPTINLDDLVNPSKLPKVKLFGREMTVRPLTGAAAHKVATAATSGENAELMLAAMLDVVRTSCPDLKEKEVQALSMDQIAAIVQLSRNQVTEVETMIAERLEKN